jgi:hypothetical protein
MVGFADPCSLNNNPGWPLRNFLVFLATHWKMRKTKVVCYRESPGKEDISHSIFLRVRLPESGKKQLLSLDKVTAAQMIYISLSLSLSLSFLCFFHFYVEPNTWTETGPGGRAVGWEKNSAGKSGPIVVSLAESMDPKR